jgi:hypothetical protein
LSFQRQAEEDQANALSSPAGDLTDCTTGKQLSVRVKYFSAARSYVVLTAHLQAAASLSARTINQDSVRLRLIEERKSAAIAEFRGAGVDGVAKPLFFVSA